MPTLPPKPLKSVDGNLNDWTALERIDFGDVAGFSLFAQAQGELFYFALTGTAEIGANTTFWFNTDQNVATGYQIFGSTGGAEFNLNIKADGSSAALYSGDAGQTLVLDNIQVAYSADHKTIEFAIPETALNDAQVINTLYDVNNVVHGPANYSGPSYIAYSDDMTRTDPTQRIGIVFSQTTASQYFSETAYSQLFMTAQSQAMQAGIRFDLLRESDLTNLAKLANYDALVFPSFSHVKAADVTAITNTLLQATKQFGIGLITAGNFMTNDETGAALAGDSYARMKLLFDATQVTGGFPADITVNSSDPNHTVFTTLDAGDVIHSYSQAAWFAFQSVSGTGQTIATETVGGQSHAAVLATQTGGKNVLFSTPGVMGDNNLLWQAINYVAKDPGIQVSLELTRSKGVVVSRTDMDQAMQITNVDPEVGPGIYDQLLPILTQWKQAFNFVGSYYIDIGNNQGAGAYTDWNIAAPYYAQILAMGNELGGHSYTHPENTNTLTPQQIQFEFQQSKLLIEQQMSAYLGRPFTVDGAAVPGAAETLPTSAQIIQYFDYLTGGFSSIGSGYPGGFGYLTPDLASAVYLAPNTSFDFTLFDFKKLTPAQASAAWAQEWNELTADGNMPIVLWPWHDYGATLWQTSPPAASPYTLEAYTAWIERAYLSGMEFVTGADLADRIDSFAASGVTSTVNGNVINVTVASPDASNFALDLVGIGSQVIQSVNSWYAYDSDSLFLPQSGGNYTITLGATANDVTHISGLPMRGDLLSVTGDGLNLDFSMVGEGDVLIDLGQFGNNNPIVTGATISSLVGDQLRLTLTGLGAHNVTLRMGTPTEVVSTVQLSADTGSSATDFVTNAAAQTILGTLSAALGAGNVVKVSLDNGATWQTAAAVAGATSFSLAGITLTGSSTLIARVENAGGQASAAFSKAYVLDRVAPTASVTVDPITTGNIINAAEALGPVAVSGTVGGEVQDGDIVTLTVGTQTHTGVVASGGYSIDVAGSELAAATTVHASVTTTDAAGNSASAITDHAYAVDIIAPTAVISTVNHDEPPVTGTVANGGSSNDTTPTLGGTAEPGGTITIFDGATRLGTATADVGDGTWSFTTPALAPADHSFTATATDAAGNVSGASPAYAVTIDTTAHVDFLTQSIEARDSVDITALLYEGGFNRSPEGAGLDHWVSALESGQLNSAGLAAAIVRSPEFTALHTGHNLAATVNSFYLNVLGRPAEQAGLDGWVNSGLSLGYILQGIALSPESLVRNDAALHGYEAVVSADALGAGAPPLETFASAPAYAVTIDTTAHVDFLTQSIEARDSVDITALLYEGGFNRSPEGAGLDHWVSALESGQLNSAGLAAAIVRSPEFTALHTGHNLAATVNSFYLNVLGRPAEQAGLDGWVNSGLSLGYILQGIALSPESLARNDPALHGYESAVSAHALGAGAPPLETFAPAHLTVQTHSPLTPQFLNTNGKLFQGDGTTPVDGFSTVVNPSNSGLLFGVDVMPRQTVTAPGGTTAGYTPLSSTFDGATHHVVYNVPSGQQSTTNGSFADVADRGAVNSNIVVGLDDSFDFMTFLAEGDRMTFALDMNNTEAVDLVTFEAVVDTASGGTLDFVVPGTPNGFTAFLGTDDTASESIQQNFVLPDGVASLTVGARFDNFLTASNSAGQITQELHWTS